MTVYEKLLLVQTELKAPKNQFNSFSNFYYRSCEDILEAAKPLLAKAKATLTIKDEMVLIGERYYIKATATFIDTETNEKIENQAYAREELNKKGMDSSQITGSTSTYARKYALNGLFCIDDTKDSDSMDNREKKIDLTKTIEEILKKYGVSDKKESILKEFNKKSFSEFDGADVKNLEIRLKATFKK